MSLFVMGVDTKTKYEVKEYSFLFLFKPFVIIVPPICLIREDMPQTLCDECHWNMNNSNSAH